MAGTPRDIEAGRKRAIAWLDEHRSRYSFLEAASLLRRSSALNLELSDPEFVRILHTTNLGFDAHEFGIRLRDEQPGAELVASLLGLSGASTPMPHYLAEEAAVDDEGGDAIRGLLNALHHRLFSTLVSGCEELSVTASYSHDSESWSARLLDLASAPEELSPAISRKILPILLSGDRSKRAIESALSIALASHIGEVGVRIREFTGAMVSLSEYQKTRLGTFSARLGETFIAGDSISMPSSGAHVIVGPTNRRLQHHFVPGASVHRTLVAVARHLISPTITLTGELRLVNEDAGAILGVSRLSDDFILPTSGEEQSLETSIALDLNPSGEPGALS